MTSDPSIAELQRETKSWPTSWSPALGEGGEWLGFWWCRDSDGGEARLSPEVGVDDYALDLALYLARLHAAVPVLLEIAAAALQARGRCDHPEGRCGNGSHYRGCPRFDGDQALSAALAKVRP